MAPPTWNQTGGDPLLEFLGPLGMPCWSSPLAIARWNKDNLKGVGWRRKLYQSMFDCKASQALFFKTARSDSAGNAVAFLV